jgi:hypothetical protein
MAVRVELRQRGVVVDGIEHWWDDLEAALDRDEATFPLLESISISPYGQIRIPHERLLELANECRLLAPRVGGTVHTLLVKVAELCDRAAVGTDTELSFDGD